mgnify:CR=1 FL=1
MGDTRKMKLAALAGGDTLTELRQAFAAAEAEIEDGIKPGVTASEHVENRELKKRVRLLEQENEVLRRAAAYSSQGALPK